MTGLTRRQFAGVTGLAGITGAGLWLGGFPGVLSRSGNGAVVRSTASLPAAYTLPFRIPPVASGLTGADGVLRYAVEQRVADLEILPGLRTRMLTYGGSFPGVTLVSRSGRPTEVTIRNTLPVPTATHLHGGHTPADSDGYPTDLLLPEGTDTVRVLPGMPADPAAQVARGTRRHVYPMRQRAATLWYHDHAMGLTARTVWQGLAGFHLVHDEEEAALGLPDGDRDLPVMLADRSFGADGALLYPPVTGEHGGMPMVPPPFRDGVLGDVLLVNGVPWPMLEAPAVRHRLRILNASNARAYRLTLSPPPPGGRGFVQVGSDGGLLERPVGRDTVEVAPGERYDVVVDLGRYQPGSVVDVVNELGEGAMAQVMRIRVGDRVADGSRVPDRLSTVERLDPAAAVVQRGFQLVNRGGGWTVNGHEFDPARADASPALGQLELWSFTSDVAHPVHLHLDPFQVVARGGPGRLGSQDVGWKDTVSLRPSETVQVAVRFTDYAGRFVFHCHNLEHEDMAMMANLVTS